jgi:uncharacterized protein (DUF4415 family)
MKKTASDEEKYVRYEVDFSKRPPRTAEQKAALAALAAKPDNEIDLSDMPELTEEFWKNAVRGCFYRPNKVSTTVRIDADVLAWLREQGTGYQTKINAILRREMLQALAK